MMAKSLAKTLGARLWSRSDLQSYGARGAAAEAPRWAMSPSGSLVT